MNIPRNGLKKTFVLVLVLVLGACAQQGGTLEEPAQMRYVATPDGCVVGGGTVGTSVDASFMTVGKYCLNPATGQWHEMRSGGNFGPTIGGQVLVAIAGTVPAAIVQGVAGAVIADRKGCGDGANCGTQISLNNGASAAAGSESTATGTGTASAGLVQPPCITCTLLD